MFKINELLKATGGRLVGRGRGIPAKGVSIDTRSIKPQEAFVAIKGNNFDGHDFILEALRKGASCIIRNPEDKNCKASSRDDMRRAAFIEVKDTVRALGDIARFQREKFNIPVIAVTGSNGKTTAKEMISWVLSRKFKVLKNLGTNNNQIGLPMTLLNLTGDYDFAVLELGTNHPGEIEYLAGVCLPNIGLITNVGPAHLEHLDSLQGVFKEKSSLLRNLKHPRIALLNGDDILLRRKIPGGKTNPITFSFGIKNRCDFSASGISKSNRGIVFLINHNIPGAGTKGRFPEGKIKQEIKFTLKTLGYYNIYNALASIAIGRIFGLEYPDIAKALSVFEFPRSRLNLVEFNNLRLIDDTYNANPVSLRQALDTLGSFNAKGRKIFVMGDMLELGDYQKLFHRQAGRKAAEICNTFITVGEFSRSAAESANKAGLDAKNIFSCRTTSEARDILFNKISPRQDDIILVKGSRLMRMEEIFLQDAGPKESQP